MLLFAFNEGVISYFKQSAAILSPIKKNADDKEHNTQALFLPENYTIRELQV